MDVILYNNSKKSRDAGEARVHKIFVTINFFITHKIKEERLLCSVPLLTTVR